jgi:hypothetical protein
MSISTFIGNIVSVSGNILSVRMSENVLSTMPIINGIVYRVGQIGSFVRVPLGYADLFGIVTQIGADAMPESLREVFLKDYSPVVSTRWLTVALVGERVDYRFERGITQFPTAGDEVHLVTIQDLNVVYGSAREESSVVVGHISASESLPARVDVDKLLTRHCAIVGATGSGKSNSVAILLQAISSGPFKSARILLIDPHGEYSETLKDCSKVFRINADSNKGQQELSIPFWALPFDELISSFPGRLNDQQKDYVREKLLEKRLESVERLKLKPPTEAITADSPIPFSLKQLWYELDDFERQTYTENRNPNTKILVKSGNADKLQSNQYEPASAGGGSPFLNFQAKGILAFLDGMRTRMLDQRYRFLFEPNDYAPDLEGKCKSDLDILLAGWLGHDKPITILDLSGVPPDITISISGSLLKVVYDAMFWAQDLPVGSRQQPLLVALEEAHNYLKAGERAISSRTVQTIAKEGRKYGVGLLLITQRPTELDETVLSQCGTIIALRMTNKGDRGHISAAVQDELYDMVALLPSLRTGEALIFGEAVQIPSRIRFYKTSHAPRSSDPVVSKEWRKLRPDSSAYQTAIHNWRCQGFMKEDK